MNSDAWDVWTQLRDKATYDGMYEILDYDSKLDLSDPTGEAEERKAVTVFA
jgi:hypothetical protein